jgi:hypothetical protein
MVKQAAELDGKIKIRLGGGEVRREKGGQQDNLERLEEPDALAP